jgi:hypothetical protein
VSIDAANAEALRRIGSAQAFLVDVRPAAELIPGLSENELLHAGPPLGGWEEACGALRGAIAGTLLQLGRIQDRDAAGRAVESGQVRLSPANDVNALATYGGVIGRRTPLLVVENRTGGVRAFAALNEGRGRALRYGANDAATLERVAWLEGEFAEILADALRRSGGIDVFAILSQALHMGDDGHSRQKAASALLLNGIAAFLVETKFKEDRIARALRFMAQNEIFFLPVTMAAAKSALATASGIPDSTIVTCMGVNGAAFGIKVAGLGGEWCTAPLPTINGRYFEGYGPQDANPVIGDSEIAETFGLGAFAMTAAPALARYVGGTPEEAARLSTQMYSITISEHERFTVPALSFRGTPFGIDARRVVETGTEPIFNTGIAHREPGIGQIGAGFGRAPLACFRLALDRLSAGATKTGARR